MHILGQKFISKSPGLSQKKKKLKSGYLELPLNVFNSVLFPAGCVVKMTWISTELSAYDVTCISVDRKKLDLTQFK